MSEQQEFEVEKQEAETPEGVERTRPGRTYVPRVDIYNTDDKVVVLADLPGADEDSLDIMLEKNVLRLRGFVEFEAPEGFDLAHAEYGVGDYERAFTVSDDIDRDNITATLNAGVLRLELPRAPEQAARKIAVRSA